MRKNDIGIADPHDTLKRKFGDATYPNTFQLAEKNTSKGNNYAKVPVDTNASMIHQTTGSYIDNEYFDTKKPSFNQGNDQMSKSIKKKQK